MAKALFDIESKEAINKRNYSNHIVITFIDVS